MPSLVPAQVIIKEKVEINPQSNVLPEYPQSYLDPCLNISRPPYYQSVYSCSGYPVEPYQQMFPWQSGGYLGQLDSATIYNVEIISGTDNAYFYKVGYWDTLSSVQVDPEYIGSSLTGLTGVELAGWGEYSVYQGIGVWEREHFALYNIRFDNYDLQTAYVTVRITNTSTNEVTDWHTTIVNPQYTMQNSGIDGDTVLHNRSITITPNISNSLALTCNQFGYGSCPPTNVTFNIEIIQGQEYGNIGKYNDFFGSFEYAPAYTELSYDEFRYGFYVFEANGLQPDSIAVVRLRQSSSDADIGSFEYTLNIKRNFLPPVSENGSIVIETSKNTAMPGDTLDILLKWEDGLNGIVDFSDWQEFGVWLADGFGYGTLLDPVTGDTSDAFEVTGKELKLIVHQDVTDANKKIVIAAETEVAVLGGNRMIQNNSQPKSETKSTDKKNISNDKTIEQGGFVKANIKIDKFDAVDKDEDDGEINIDFIIGSRYLSGIKEITVNPFIVEIDPPTVSAGDTAKIIPKYMDSTGNYVEYDSLQIFELGMLDGCVLGKLNNAGMDTNYFYGVTQPFYFIADTSADRGNVNIRVGIIDMNTQNRNITNNNSNIENDSPVDYCFINIYQSKLFLDVPLPIEQKYEILLGETKYYQVKYSDPLTGKLVIDELSGPYYWNEKGEPIKQDVWGNNPVSIVECDKLSVYWETEKPVWDGNNFIRDLPIGIIRLVGRYWQENTTYKVKLTARTTIGDSTSIDIEVKRPTKLLTDGQTPAYKTATNVLGGPFDIDSLCIYWGGLYGIPPQMLKGHMLKESAYRPAYRFEPYTGQFYVDNIVKKNTNPFIVNSLGMGKPGAKSVPTKLEHKGVREIHYYENPSTVWDFITVNSQLIDPNNSNTGFGSQHKTGRLKGQIKYSASYSILRKYNNIFLPAWTDSLKKRNKFPANKDLPDSLQIVANDSARVAFLYYMQYKWKKKDLDKIYAQTRIASSYGLLQSMYTTSVNEGFGTGLNDRPENLNEPEGFKYNIFHYATLFKKNGYGFDLTKTSNFISTFKDYNSDGNLIFETKPGYDEAFRTIAYLWNKWEDGYHKTVFTNMIKFLPGDK